MAVDEQGDDRPAPAAGRIRTAWSRRPPARVAREMILMVVLGPIVRFLGRPRVTGRSALADLARPVVFAANHSSHVDTPTLLIALPARWRRRTLVVAAADYFYADEVRGAAVSLAFGTIPIERSGGVSEESAARMHRLITQGWCLLLYPEGTRSRDGTLGTLHRGAAALATAHQVPLVPIGLIGTHEVLPKGRSWFRRHPITVRIGEPLAPGGPDDVDALTDRLRAALLALTT